MRFSLLPIAAAVVALALFAPAAGARLIDPQPAATPSGQDLRSPDARDADAATRARTLQDLIRRHHSLGTSSLAGTSRSPRPPSRRSGTTRRTAPRRCGTPRRTTAPRCSRSSSGSA